MAAIKTSQQKNESWGMVFLLVFILLVMSSVVEFIPAVPDLDSLVLERTVYLMVLGTIVYLVGKYVTLGDL